MIPRAAFALTLFSLACEAGAVGVSTGANSGNWAWLNPTSAKLGIGTSSSTNPAEKLTVQGGNILIDNGRTVKSKLAGSSTTTSLLGLNSSNALSLYGGKIMIASNGNVGIGVTPLAPFHVGRNAAFDGEVGIEGVATFGDEVWMRSPLHMMSTADVAATLTASRINANSLGVANDFGVDGQAFFGDEIFARSPLHMMSSADVSGPLTANDIEAQHLIVNNEIQALSDISVSGSLFVSGIKLFVQAHPTDSTKLIQYVAAEAGEPMTLVRGVSMTQGGSVRIALPEHFALVTSVKVPLTIELTPKGAPALLYVASESTREIEVKMKKSDFDELGDVSFSYFVQGARDGFEDHQPIRDVNAEAPPVSEKQRAILARTDARMAKILKAKGKLRR